MTDVAAKDSLTVTDNRTGQQYDIAINDNTTTIGKRSMTCRLDGPLLPRVARLLA